MTSLVREVVYGKASCAIWCSEAGRVHHENMSALTFYIAKIGYAGLYLFLARLHEVHRAIAVTSVVHVPVPVPVRVLVTLALKFSRSPYLDNHSSESIHTWTIDIL